NHKERVKPRERDRVDGEEVRRKHAVRLGAQELGPGWASPRGGSQAASAQDPPDRGGCDADTELAQLALDAHTSPAAILPTETNDEVDELLLKRRTARAALSPPSAPLPIGGLAVPAQQGLGGDQERTPARSGEQPAERC